MTETERGLFDAFKSDHAVLGLGPHDIRSYLMKGDVCSVREAAVALDGTAGPHLTFEEADLYTALKPYLSKRKIADMYAEHARGALANNEIIAPQPDVELPKPDQNRMVRQIEKFSNMFRIAEELFGAIGGLSDADTRSLLERLNDWQRRMPAWRDIAAGTPLAKPF